MSQNDLGLPPALTNFPSTYLVPPAWLLAPVVLSALVLAAHFMRRGEWVPMLVSLGLLALLFVRREWARRMIQLALLLGAIEWARTLAGFVAERRALGEPWLRMAIILGSVIAVALAGIAALESARLRRRFARPPRPAA